MLGLEGRNTEEWEEMKPEHEGDRRKGKALVRFGLPSKGKDRLSKVFKERVSHKETSHSDTIFPQ